MKWFLLVIAILFISFIPTQQVSYQQKQAYFKKLLAIQSKMSQKVQKLRKINSDIIFNVDTLKGQPSLQKSLLQQGVKIQRNQIQSTFHQTLIPLKDNYWSCKSLSNSQKQLIAQKIKSLKDKTAVINKQIQNQNDCQRTVQLKSQLQFLNLHIESLENQLSNVCQPFRKDDKKINNLDTGNNWIYGSYKPKDYQKIIDDMENQFNLVKCEKEKPFLINNQCGACSKPQQIYSLSQSKCIQKCPDGTVFLKLNHKCVDPKKKVFVPQNLDKVDPNKNPYIWGPITPQQYKDQITQLKTNNIPTQQCPADKPFNENGQSCVACSNGQIFNIGAQQCANCKSQQKYIQKTHQCKQVFKKPNYDAGKNWIAPNGNSKPIDDKLKDLQNQNYPVEQCPSDKPFPTKDFKQCVSCNKFYNIIKGECLQCNKFFIVKPGQHDCSFVTQSCQQNQFWTGQKCLKCFSPGKYDNNYKQCICSAPYKYDESLGQCLPASQNLKNANPNKATNFVGTSPKISKFIQNCPQQKPFFDQNSQSCVQCALPSKYYNYDNKKCEQCDKNLQFNIKEKKCIQPVQIFNSNLGSGIKNYCCGQPAVTPGKQNCPNDRPFFDGYHCVSCSKPQYFDFKDHSCKLCPTGKDFNQIKKQCIDSALTQPKLVSNIPSNIKNYMGDIPSDKPETQGQQVNKCPQDKPFSNGKQCLKCQLPRYFNFQSKQCQLCQQGYTFSIEGRQCQKNTVIGQNIFNSNMMNAQNFIGQVPPYKRQYPECPTDKRYFNNVECIKCQLPKYWNFDKNQCSECSKGLYFDKLARSCIYEAGEQKFKTNLDVGKNVYYNGNFDDVKKQVQNGSNKTSCPSDRPYYDKSSNECINCNGNENIFNWIKNHCMSCPNNTHFNDQYHICFQNGVKPTIQRMVMNSVRWI